MGSKKRHSTTLTVLLNFRVDDGVSLAADALALCWKWRFNSYTRNPHFLVSQEIGNNGRYLGGVGGGVRALI